MVTFADIESRQPQLVRKSLRAVLFVGPNTAPAITALTDPSTGEINTIDPLYKALGLITTDGLSWPRETELSEIFAHGGAEPVRSDVRRSIKRVSFSLQETSRSAIELYEGVDLSAITTTDGGETVWDEPELPDYKYQRFLAVAKDTAPGGDYYLWNFFPSARVTEAGELVWSDEDNAMVRQVTMTAFLDSTLGTACRKGLCGPGRTAEIIEDEGFAEAAS